jgi:hypothetical protein
VEGAREKGEGGKGNTLMERNAIIAIVAVVVVVLLLCCCVVAASVALTGSCAALGIGGAAAVVSMPGPYGIDERPAVPAGTTPQDVLPSSAGGYAAGPATSITSFAGVALPGGAKGVIYAGAGGEVQTFAVQTTSEPQAWRLVDQIEERVKEAKSSSRLSRSLPGKPAFVQWRVSDWKESVYGVVWNNGEWVFGVASSSQTARDAVADAFPY